MGSSFLPGELIAAFLWAQLEEAGQITQERLACWLRYHLLLQPLEEQGLIRRPIIPKECQHNAHMYYVLLASEIDRQHVLSELKQDEISALFHYVPLHTTSAGQKYGRTSGPLDVTLRKSGQIVRLPLWFGITAAQQDRGVQMLRQSVAG